MSVEAWLTCTIPYTMLLRVRGRTSDRKLRLFAAGCCRQLGNIIGDARCWKAIEVAENFADGRADSRELAAAYQGAWRAAHENPLQAPIACAFAAETTSFVIQLAISASNHAHYHRFNTHSMESREQADLLRHIVGNPFAPQSSPEDCPFTVSSLAEALYDGQRCNFALYDALLEAGHPELAAHFREPEHPKGCWALDLILGKK